MAEGGSVERAATRRVTVSTWRLNGCASRGTLNHGFLTVHNGRIRVVPSWLHHHCSPFSSNFTNIYIYSVKIARPFQAQIISLLVPWLDSITKERTNLPPPPPSRKLILTLPNFSLPRIFIFNNFALLFSWRKIYQKIRNYNNNNNN